MDINPTYNCLFGRPWIHAAGAVTSTLHQKPKFTVKDRLIIVYGEEDVLISHLSSFLYVEASEEEIEVPFQALGIENDVYLREEAQVSKNKPSFASVKSAKMSMVAGKLDSWGEIVQVREKKDRHSLGYGPYQQMKAQIPMKNWQRKIQEVFHSGGVIHDHHVNTIDEVSTTDNEDLVRRCAPDEELDNWKAEELFVTFPLLK